MKRIYCVIVALALALLSVSCSVSSDMAAGDTAPATEQAQAESVQEITAEPQEELVVFNDSVLEEKIREAMNRPEGDITVIEARTIKRLDFDIEWQSPEEMMIKDISALKYFENLEELEIQFHAITDVGPLAGLVELRGLALGGNNIQDISALASLKELNFLSIFNCQASDYSVLENFTYLFGLHIDYSNFDDLSLLSGMNDLQRLTFVETKVSDVTPISHLTKLKVLKLEGCPIDDLSPLKDIYPNLDDKDFELE
ncbi:MAG: leucine-rich repeat domain-containing protein [Actinobacteria bacterium]|nr:leucine-rich repeat domain-containing protein [Actinomycetota bacterium]